MGKTTCRISFINSSTDSVSHSPNQGQNSRYPWSARSKFAISNCWRETGATFFSQVGFYLGCVSWGLCIPKVVRTLEVHRYQGIPNERGEKVSLPGRWPLDRRPGSLVFAKISHLACSIQTGQTSLDLPSSMKTTAKTKSGMTFPSTSRKYTENPGWGEPLLDQKRFRKQTSILEQDHSPTPWGKSDDNSS